ncbi:MAG: hypothetical protein J7K26_03515 [Candidatus Aenigmarchaeota archaeon]|nr:hypothetical protein [Candidatus Aenigmarchaeota archaeon]
MLSDDLRQKLIQNIRKDPREAIKILEKEPQILEMLLNTEKEVEREKHEKIKYVNMTMQMQKQLQEKAKQLKTTQGLLIGAGVLLLLSLLDE